MKRLTSLLLFVSAAFLGWLAAPGPAGSQNLKNEIQKAGGKPIQVESKTLELNDKKKTVTFADNVHAKIDNFAIQCSKMVVYYEGEQTAQKGAAKVDASIDRIVATGQVKIIRGKGGTATAEKGVYYQRGEKVVLTGKPVVKKGNDSVTGCRITIFLKENRSIVEACPNKKVRAVIHPDREKK
ncbi:MAG: lipopolysaccharide transport periplasmic protein LptA [Deltaproteobacteria bacterium]|nr:lipopolysaccharide transport periplasmic protein LptA [Deltaproteobacteria bacterium]